MTIAVIGAEARPLLEDRLPAGVEPRWVETLDEALAAAPEAEIAWLDRLEREDLDKWFAAAPNMKWLFTRAAGVESFPLDMFAERGIVFTNSPGLNSVAVAEYAVLGLLTLAKGYRDVVRAQARHEWLEKPPGTIEIAGTRALVIGGGGVGGRIAGLLRAFDVEVATVRRRPAPGALGPDAWRAKLAEFDWVILALPSTPDTAGTIGAAELAAMRPDASILNFARGPVIDTDALMTALNEGQIASAYLDVTDPEPLPPEHPLWSFDNVHIGMHLSGRSQDSLLRKSSHKFLENLDRWQRGETLANIVDLRLGY
jgi:phosphoglycerate dehydrogenase-like enzyme